MSSKKAVRQTDAELAPFANNSHETEYTRMMHRYADLDKREKTLRRKQCFANWMLFRKRCFSDWMCNRNCVCLHND